MVIDLNGNVIRRRKDGANAKDNSVATIFGAGCSPIHLKLTLHRTI